MKKILLLFSSMYFFGCVSVTNAVLDNDRHDREFLIANDYFNNQEFDKAAAIYEDILKEHKDSYIAAKLAEVYLAERQPEKAKRLLEDMLKDKKFKDDDYLNFYLGKILIEYLNQLDEGKKYIENAAKINEDEQYLEYLARIYEAKEDFSSAIGIYTKLIAKEMDPEYYYKRGYLYIKLGLIKDAISDLMKADDYQPNLRARLLLSDVYISQNEYEKAAEYLKKALELNSQFPSVKLKLAEVYKKLGMTNDYAKILEDTLDSYQGKQREYILRQLAAAFFELKDYDNAIKYFTFVLNDSPEDTQALFFLGVVYEAKGDIENAIKFYEKAYGVRNDYFEPLKRIAYLLYKNKKYDLAVNYLDKVGEQGRDIEYFRLKAAIYEDMGEIALAIKVVEDGLLKNPESEELLFSYAILMEKEKKHKEVINTMKKLLEINPKNPTYLNFLGYLYADIGINLDEAYDLIKSALKYEPENAAYLDSMAWVLYKMKRYKEAYDFQLKALKKSPSEKEMREHMLEIMKALNIDKPIDDVIKD